MVVQNFYLNQKNKIYLVELVAQLYYKVKSFYKQYFTELLKKYSTKTTNINKLK